MWNIDFLKKMANLKKKKGRRSNGALHIQYLEAIQLAIFIYLYKINSIRFTVYNVYNCLQNQSPRGEQVQSGT